MPFKIHIDLEKRGFINYLLLPFAIIFYILSVIRSSLYQLKILKAYHSVVPVIIVGNITIGGTGKTPIVINLIKFFSNRSKKVGVVSRGYGRVNSDLVIIDNHTKASECGDEPLLIYRTTKATVVVSSNRVQAVKTLERLGVEIIISDDGLQHYAMARDIEIVASRGFTNGFLLPAGGLREMKSRLKTVDFVINDSLRKIHNIAFVNAKTGEQQPLNYFNNIECFAFCGIAQPRLFFDNLLSLGIKNLETKVFKDHYNYKLSDIHNLINLAKPIIMTAKDWVKCQEFATENMWYLATEIIIKSSFYDKLEKKLCLTKNY